MGISLSMKKESDFLFPGEESSFSQEVVCLHGLVLLGVRGSARVQTHKLSGNCGEGREPLE